MLSQTSSKVTYKPNKKQKSSTAFAEKSTGASIALWRGTCVFLSRPIASGISIPNDECIIPCSLVKYSLATGKMNFAHQ
jgi:hypothetical protein